MQESSLIHEDQKPGFPKQPESLFNSNDIAGRVRSMRFSTVVLVLVVGTAEVEKRQRARERASRGFRENNNGAPGTTGVTRLRGPALAARCSPGGSPGLIYPRSRALLH